MNYHSDDSILDFEEEEKHHALPRNHQMFLQNYSFNHHGNAFHNGFSVDDGGMDEYDVADERAHMFEYVNPDNMTYEEIIALQERIGFVNKGLQREKINSFPKMKRRDVQLYIDKKKKKIVMSPLPVVGREEEEDCPDFEF